MRKTAFVILAMSLFPCAFAVDGVVLINQSTVIAAGGFPYTITQPGSYRLSGNLTVPDANTSAISITADNVTVDLNGFSIIGPTVCLGNPVTSCSPTGSGNGVEAGLHQNITVANGAVHGMGGSGIDVAGLGGFVQKVHVDSNGGAGILGGAVSSSTANRNGNAGINAENFPGSISGNTTIGNHLFGIFAACPSSIVGNTAYNNAQGNLLTSGAGCALANNAAP